MFVRVLGCLALCLTASTALAQRSTAWRTQSAEERFQKSAERDALRALAGWAGCVARNRGEAARAMALARFGSEEQGRLANGLIRRGSDNCLTGFEGEVRMQLTGSLIAGSLSQARVLREHPQLARRLAGTSVDSAQENLRLQTLAPGEIFGRCVLRRNPQAALALIASVPMSSEETASVAALQGDFSQCLAQGSTIQLNLSGLRGMIGAAAYRLGSELPAA